MLQYVILHMQLRCRSFSLEAVILDFFCRGGGKRRKRHPNPLSLYELQVLQQFSFQQILQLYCSTDNNRKRWKIFWFPNWHAGSKGEGRRQVTSRASFPHCPNDPKYSFVYTIDVISVRCLCQFGTAIQSHTNTRRAAWKRKRPMPRSGIPTVQRRF